MHIMKNLEGILKALRNTMGFSSTKHLRTVYPNGLNKTFGKITDSDNETLPSGKFFRKANLLLGN